MTASETEPRTPLTERWNALSTTAKYAATSPAIAVVALVALGTSVLVKANSAGDLSTEA